MKKATEIEIKQNGFSLVEILAAVVILAFIALSIMALLPMGYRQITQSGRRSVMSHLALEKIDELKGLDERDRNLSEGIHPTSGPYRLDTPTDLDLTGYSLVWEVDDKNPIDNVKLVVVEVGYYLYNMDNSKISSSDSQNQLRETYTTYIARPDK